MLYINRLAKLSGKEWMIPPKKYFSLNQIIVKRNIVALLANKIALI